jgi:hypothetical protein
MTQDSRGQFNPQFYNIIKMKGKKLQYNLNPCLIKNNATKALSKCR